MLDPARLVFIDETAVSTNLARQLAGFFLRVIPWRSRKRQSELRLVRIRRLRSSRVRGRAPSGDRVIGTVPLGAWETITFVAALRHNKMTAPMVVEGAMTG